MLAWLFFGRRRPDEGKLFSLQRSLHALVERIFFFPLRIFLFSALLVCIMSTHRFYTTLMGFSFFFTDQRKIRGRRFFSCTAH